MMPCARREHDGGDIGGLRAVSGDVEWRRGRDDLAVIRRGAAACAEADTFDIAAGRFDSGDGLRLEVFVVNQYFGLKPIQRLAEPLRRLAHMQAAGDASAQGGGEPRHRMPCGTAAQMCDHLTLRGAVIGKALRDP
jgi:hypothetical protein